MTPLQKKSYKYKENVDVEECLLYVFCRSRKSALLFYIALKCEVTIENHERHKERHTHAKHIKICISMKNVL